MVELLCRSDGKKRLQCVFTKAPAEVPVRVDRNTETLHLWLPVRDFFDPGTAVISSELAD